MNHALDFLRRYIRIAYISRVLVFFFFYSFAMRRFCFTSASAECYAPVIFLSCFLVATAKNSAGLVQSAVPLPLVSSC